MQGSFQMSLRVLASIYNSTQITQWNQAVLSIHELLCEMHVMSPCSFSLKMNYVLFNKHPWIRQAFPGTNWMSYRSRLNHTQTIIPSCMRCLEGWAVDQHHITLTSHSSQPLLPKQSRKSNIQSFLVLTEYIGKMSWMLCAKPQNNNWQNPDILHLSISSKFVTSTQTEHLLNI